MKKAAVIASICLAAALGFTAPAWAGPVIAGLNDVARFVLDTHLLMMMDAEGFRVGCL
jgi:hypothetical protein